MAKRKVSAKELAEDIKTGMPFDDICQKYEASAQGLTKGIASLLQRGLITAEDAARCKQTPAKVSKPNTYDIYGHRDGRAEAVRIVDWPMTVFLIITVPAALAVVIYGAMVYDMLGSYIIGQIGEYKRLGTEGVILIKRSVCIIAAWGLILFTLNQLGWDGKWIRRYRLERNGFSIKGRVKAKTPKGAISIYLNEVNR